MMLIQTDNRKAVQQADSTDELSLVRELESDESDYESEQITETEVSNYWELSSPH